MWTYSLAKSKKIFFHAHHLFMQRKMALSSALSQQLTNTLTSLEQAILDKDKKQASLLAKQTELFLKNHLPKSAFERTRDFILGLVMALAIALLIRQMWFELYEIPTGSMRPTFKEQDRVSVSKTDFGINLPFSTKHLYFNPKLVQRNGIFIFTVEDMDFRDADTVYFYIFPGKKLLIKRLMGKPGDTLYFYGGKIYGMDEKGHDISQELQLAQLDKIEHVPFTTFEGKVETSSTHTINSPVTLYQMNEPIAKLWALSSTQAKGELFSKFLLKDPHMRYSDLWGIGNFAKVRLLSKEQVIQFTNQDITALPDAVLYLEIKHHPNLRHVQIGRDERNRLRPLIGLSTSIIPLQEHHLKALADNLYTSRFVVDKGFAHRYGLYSKYFGSNHFFPYLPDVPNGTYEFYYGKAYAVKWQGITAELAPSSPLYRFDPQRLQLLFNLGMEFDTRFSPQSKQQYLKPSRYAYFREGDLYIMGAPILKKDDPTLTSFVEREKNRQLASRDQKTYEPFIDQGPPLLPNGELNKEFIQTFGLKIPPKSYLALGDNHAGSGDSREFGFVPEGNIRGGPDLIFWPPGTRMGRPNQPPYPFFNISRCVIWALGAGSIGLWYYFHRKRYLLPIYTSKQNENK